MASSESITLIAVCLLAATYCLSASASDGDNNDSIQPISQELLLGESPFVQEEDEIELGLILDFPADIAGNRLSALVFEMEYGVTERFTVSAELPYQKLESDSIDANGPGDLELSALYALHNDNNLIVSIGVGSTLPSGNEDKQLGEGETAWESMFSVGKLFEDSQLVFTSSFEINEDEIEQGYTVSWAKQYSRLVFAIDLNAEFSDDEEEFAIAPSLLFDHQEFGKFQIGVATGVDSDSPDWRLLAHWYVEFE